MNKPEPKDFLEFVNSISRFTPSNYSNRVSDLVRRDDLGLIDMDSFLPTKGFNLQRDFVWGLDQKRELIMSILVRRYIPKLCFVYECRDRGSDDTFVVIDGKQRLSTAIDFVKDKFTLVLDGHEYLFSELPERYQNAVSKFHFETDVIISSTYCGKPVTDDDKIEWFAYINCAGVAQDSEHILKLKEAVSK